MNDETGNREYKRQLDRDDRFERAVVAFLNSRDGGTIYLGVEDDGSVCGVAAPDLVQRQAAERIRNNVRPATMGLFDIGLEERDGRPCHHSYCDMRLGEYWEDDFAPLFSDAIRLGNFS